MAFFKKVETLRWTGLAATMKARSSAQKPVTLQTMQHLTLKDQSIDAEDLDLLTWVERVTCDRCIFTTPLTPFLTGRTTHLTLAECDLPAEETGASFATLDTLHHYSSHSLTAPLPIRALHCKGAASAPCLLAVRETLSVMNGDPALPAVFANLQVSTLIIDAHDWTFDPFEPFAVPAVWPLHLTALHLLTDNVDVSAMAPNDRITHLTCSTDYFAGIGTLFPNLEVLRLIPGIDIVPPLDASIARLHTLHVYGHARLSNVLIPLKVFFHDHDVKEDVY